ncbi:MAG: hypothetical protein CMC14_14180 [Flavobacteriaceae bacterium]|nr:hypothetical protein [Flavobacteriaceae bacterium]
MSSKYKIHPAIGIARVGDSEAYYLAPETEGGLPTKYSTYPNPKQTFRDNTGKLLRQAAQFKIYEYSAANPEGVVVTPGQNGVKSIQWTTWIASKKASWFQFMQQTGSGMGPYVDGVNVPTPPANAPYVYKNDEGYLTNNANNPFTSSEQRPSGYDPNAPTWPSDNNKPSNPLRYNLALGTSNDPSTMNDANRQQLILDPGPITLNGANQSGSFDLDPATYPFLSKLSPFPISTLGSALTDDKGGLIVLGGFGNSGSTSNEGSIITAYANNEGWFDDIADGPVTATIIMDDGSQVKVDVPAWVSVGPPAYAPQIINQVNLYDDIYDVYVRELNANPALFSNGEFQTSYVPNYYTEVQPILMRPDLYQYVAGIPSLGTGNHFDLINDSPEVFAGFAAKYLRGRGAQGDPQSGPAENQPSLMPLLAGDNPISNFTASKFLGLTATQFFILSQFASGKMDKTNPKPLPTGVALDKANLENCVGGAFCPGIEITWITRNTSIYQPLPSGFDASDLFRIKQKDMSQLTKGKLSLTNGADNNYANGLEPGDLTKYMAQPWQADFNECSIQNINTVGPNKPAIQNGQVNIWWWPAQRPYTVKNVNNQNKQVQWTRGFAENTNANNFGDVQMVTCWKYLGFVTLEGSFPGAFESERNTEAIDNYKPPTPPAAAVNVVAKQKNA